MKVFITGCNGLVGSYIARKLLKEGAEVSALKRKDSLLDHIQDITHKITWHEGDITDLLSIETPIKEADFVIHCAGFVSFLAQDYSKMLKINVEGTANIVNTCLKFGHKKILYISSVAALGINVNQQVVDETQKWDDGNISSKYGHTKFLGEAEVWRGHSEGLDVIVVNPSVVLGRGEWGRSSLALLKYASSNPLFYPKGDVNYVDARDLASIIYHLIIEKIYNERFIVSAGKISYQELIEIICNSMGTKVPKLPFNNFVALIILQLTKLMSLFTGKPPKLSRETIKMSMRKTLFSNKKIVKQLNFKFRAIQDTIAWLAP